jgi:hypothetical protein
MGSVVFYLRGVAGADLDSQRQACHRLVGGQARVLAEVIGDGANDAEKLLEALDLSSRNGATFVAAP